MKILSFGNSFSKDAHRYIYSVAKADGYPMKTVNLCIGGCPLREHYLNALEDKKYILWSLTETQQDSWFRLRKH